jgi:hypothetical protein
MFQLICEREEPFSDQTPTLAAATLCELQRSLLTFFSTLTAVL